MTRKQKNKNTSSLREQDPFLARERETYEFPLPSREFVLQCLEQAGVPVIPEELAEQLGILDDEMGFFQRRLRAMARDGQLVINRKGQLCVIAKMDLKKGRVIGHRDGFGFIKPEEGGDDLFLSEREMHTVLHGDHVIYRVAGQDRRGRNEAAIVEILQRANTRVVGRLYRERGIFFVVPEDRRINQDILIEANEVGEAQHGQVVIVEIVAQPSKHTQPMGRVLEIMGNYADPGMEIEIALRKHDLPHVFSHAVEEAAKAIPKKVRKKDLEGREDLRELPLVTIDGETARDFDDAVYCEPQGKGFRLVVAIADVSSYVLPGDALDVSAKERGNSVYFPRRVIPMLPEALSNGICSLNPEVERLCMVCDMVITAKGEVKKYRFYPAVMRSQARLTYNQVWDYLQAEGGHPLYPHLANLYDLFKCLLAARARRGAIDFETTETQMVFNEQGKIDRIVPVVRNDAHRLIEECMLAANVCSADFLLTHQHPCLFRVHEGPTPEKLDVLRGFLKLVALTLPGGETPTAKDYAKLMEKIKLRPDGNVLQTMLLRSLQQAVYTPNNVGHFGLAYPAYTHFTSPIRRYPDLLVHRAIKALLAGEVYRPRDWVALGTQCSMTERRADEATREVEAWLKCFFMRDRVGEVFSGKINAVTSFGVFVLLDDVFVEGLIHISELGRDYFHFDMHRQAIVGEKSGMTYKLGDEVTIKVMRADLESAKIDFALYSPSRDQKRTT